MAVLRFDVSSSFNRLPDPIFVIHFLFFIRCWNRVRFLFILFIRCLMNLFGGLLLFSSFTLFLTVVISWFLMSSIFYLGWQYLLSVIRCYLEWW